MRLWEELAAYATVWLTAEYPGSDPLHERTTLRRFQTFLDSSAKVFERSHPPGHITASALLTDPRLERVALMHHRKLDRWLQMGGHADGELNLPVVALREVEEEGGLRDLSFLEFEQWLGQPLHPMPFDLDIHPIPARGEVGEHLHYDVRYLLVTRTPEELMGNAESHQVGWFGLDEARKLTQEASMLRQFDKFSWLRGRLLTRA